MQPPGKIATMCSVRLQGKHKPIYHALSESALVHHILVVTNDAEHSPNSVSNGYLYHNLETLKRLCLAHLSDNVFIIFLAIE